MIEAAQRERRRVRHGTAHVRGGTPGGEWDLDWRGWWGEDPPYHTPVFVLTHHERAPLPMEGGTTFHFVTDGIEDAVARAREAAGEADVSIGGGASTLQQAIAAGLLDEIVVNQVPILLGAGERLFDNLDAGAADARRWPTWSRARKPSTSPTALELVGA